MANSLLGSLTHTEVSVLDTSTVIKAADGNRKYLLIVNDSDTNIYIYCGAAAVLNKGIRLNANGGSFEMSGDGLYAGAINGISSVTGKTVLVTQGV